jgi:hypothetical protein
MLVRGSVGDNVGQYPRLDLETFNRSVLQAPGCSATATVGHCGCLTILSVKFVSCLADHLLSPFDQTMAATNCDLIVRGPQRRAGASVSYPRLHNVTVATPYCRFSFLGHTGYIRV